VCMHDTHAETVRVRTQVVLQSKAGAGVVCFQHVPLLNQMPDGTVDGSSVRPQIEIQIQS